MTRWLIDSLDVLVAVKSKPPKKSKTKKAPKKSKTKKIAENSTMVFESVDEGSDEMYKLPQVLAVTACSGRLAPLG